MLKNKHPWMLFNSNQLGALPSVPNRRDKTLSVVATITLLLIVTLWL
ncbi:hypothetical protein N9X86_04185 [Porticoccaceae bacterium]|nr:hypothetical protein [Porticoccaceae bacterium]